MAAMSRALPKWAARWRPRWIICASNAWVRFEAIDCACNSGRIARIEQQRGIARHLGQTRHVAAQHWLATRHRFEHRQAKSLVERREDQSTASLEHGDELALRQVPGKSKTARRQNRLRQGAQLVGRGARRASADQRQIRGWKRAAILGERLYQNAMVLVRPRVGGIQQKPSRTHAQPVEYPMRSLAGVLVCIERVYERRVNRLDAFGWQPTVGQDRLTHELRHTDETVCQTARVQKMLVTVPLLLRFEEIRGSRGTEDRAPPTPGGPADQRRTAP